MIIKAKLDKPYTEEQRLNFIVEYNHRKGYIVAEVDTGLRAMAESKEEQAQAEKEAIMRLSMTKLDFVNALEAFGITYIQIKELLASSEEAQKQWDLCERVYRFNPLLDEYCSTFNITSEQLDQLFINAQKDQNLL